MCDKHSGPPNNGAMGGPPAVIPDPHGFRGGGGVGSGEGAGVCVLCRCRDAVHTACGQCLATPPLTAGPPLDYCEASGLVLGHSGVYWWCWGAPPPHHVALQAPPPPPPSLRRRGTLETLSARQYFDGQPEECLPKVRENNPPTTPLPQRVPSEWSCHTDRSAGDVCVRCRSTRACA